MVLKSPRRSRVMRMLSNSRVSQASFIRPRSQIRVGTMRSPSWYISCTRPDRLPGVMPPTSPQWHRVAVNIARRPSWNTG